MEVVSWRKRISTVGNFRFQRKFNSVPRTHPTKGRCLNPFRFRNCSWFIEIWCLHIAGTISLKNIILPLVSFVRKSQHPCLANTRAPGYASVVSISDQTKRCPFMSGYGPGFLCHPCRLYHHCSQLIPLAFARCSMARIS